MDQQNKSEKQKMIEKLAQLIEESTKLEAQIEAVLKTDERRWEPDSRDEQ